MLVRFFFLLRSAGVPVSILEFLTLLEALAAGVVQASPEHFYHLARTCLVKDERNYDRFDRVFSVFFNGAEAGFEKLTADLPAEWLARLAERTLSEEEKAQVRSLGGWEQLWQALRSRLAEQQGRHQGGSKWIGTAGTSPFGAYGYNPEGIRIGQEGSRNRSAVKVWDRREYANLDDQVELGRATSSWPCAACGVLPVREQPPNWICATPSIPPRAVVDGWICAWCRNVTMP